jgi:hypothetical protein
VVGADLLFQGEFLAEGTTLQRTRQVENPREAAAYTFGYNATLFAQRTHDVLTLIAFAKQRINAPVDLIGLEGAGPWAAAARAEAGNVIARAAIDTGGFRFGEVPEIHHPSFLPGGAKYGDVMGMLAVAAPGELWVAGEDAQTSQLVAAAYRACSKEEALTRFDGPTAKRTAAAVDWLLDRR